MKNRDMHVMILIPGSSMDMQCVESLIGLSHMMKQSGIRHTLKFQAGSNIYNLRNALLEVDYDTREGDPPFKGNSYTHIFWIDTDMVYHPEDGMRLLMSPHPITGGVYQDTRGELTAGKWDVVHLGTDRYMPRYTLRELSELSDDRGYAPVDWQGFGFLVMRRGVCESIGFPWFRADQIETELYTYLIGEDVWFCRSAKDKGYQAYIDTGVVVGHRKLINLIPGI